jgi:hypothetical protein
MAIEGDLHGPREGNGQTSWDTKSDVCIACFDPDRKHKLPIDSRLSRFL